MIYPVQYAVNAPIKALGRLSRQIRTHQDLVAANERLRAENMDLRSRSQKYAALTRENVRLRELLDSSAEFSETVVGADVLAIETSPSARQIVIDKGSRHGVYVGQPVVDAYGILGQIVQVGPFSSTALLITDVSHAAPVQINRTGLRAISVGTDGVDELRLSFVPTSADVEVGDLVVTSGLGDRFPAGYPVGKVAAVEIDHGEPFARILITPSAQVSRVREVLLVWPQRQSIEDAQVSAVDPDVAE
jgi:rod shape-determining protein MreC